MTYTIRRRLTTTLALSLFVSMCAAGGVVSAADERRSRIERLENSVLAPCCYTEPVSRHNSDVSVKMRVEIQNWVNAGKTDEEILGAYKVRYGARVIAPAPHEAWLWSEGMPWFLILLSGAGVVRLLARWRARPAIGPAVANGWALPALPESEEDWARIDHQSDPPQSPNR